MIIEVSVGLEAFLIRHGPLAVVAGAALEGDMTLILAGVIAHLGIFSFPTAIAAGALGTYIADLFWFLVGKWRGPALRNTRLYGHVGPKVERWARRFGSVQLWYPYREHGLLGPHPAPADPVPAHRPGRVDPGGAGLRRPRLGIERQHHRPGRPYPTGRAGAVGRPDHRRGDRAVASAGGRGGGGGRVASPQRATSCRACLS